MEYQLFMVDGMIIVVRDHITSAIKALCCIDSDDSTECDLFLQVNDYPLVHHPGMELIVWPLSIRLDDPCSVIWISTNDADIGVVCY